MDIFKGCGVEVIIEENDFLKITETLTRIGILSNKNKTLTQSCHILHRQGRYAIVCFKEMFYLDGKTADIDENDYARRNTIARLLQDWGLLTIKEPLKYKDLVPISEIRIIPYKEKSSYNLVSKYSIGKKRGRN